MKIGVLSDTHGILPDSVREIFRDVDRIVHAGDIGSEEVIFTLEAIAPVHAVHGNVDHYPLTARYRSCQLITLDGYTIYVQHEPITPFEKWYDPIGYLANHQKVNIVIYGHTHLGKIDWLNDILFLNPGSVFRGKKGIDRTVAILDLAHAGTPEIKFIKLA